MLKVILFVLLLFYAKSSLAFLNNWKEDDKKLFYISNAALIADWYTTKNLLEDYPGKVKETNPLLGSAPSQNKLDRFFLGNLVLNYAIANYFTEYRSTYLKLRIGLSAAAALNNYYLGIRIEY